MKHWVRLVGCKRFYSLPKTTKSSPNPIKLDEKVITDQFQALRDKYEAPRYPIVLCHGFSGFDQLSILPHKQRMEHLLHGAGFLKLDYWFGIKEALQDIGSNVLIARVPAFGRIKNRANLLNDFINQQCETLRKLESKRTMYNEKRASSSGGNEDSDSGSELDSSHTFEQREKPIKINLIAHSMGGLDCRYLISQLKHSNYQVVSLTTVATPHHGSECADFLMEVARGTPLQKLFPASIAELTTSYLKEFNRTVPNDRNVAYFSYGARFKPHWYNVFLPTWNIIKMQMRKHNQDKKVISVDNDGIVSVASSKWGEYLGTLDEVDHLDLINWTNRARTTVDKALFRKEPKFNAIALYLDIADNLRKRGF